MWFSRRSPRLHSGTSGFSACLCPLANSVFRLLLGQVKKRPPLPLIPNVKIECNNILQSALKSMKCVLPLPWRWNYQISPGNWSSEACVRPWTQSRFAKQGNWVLILPPPPPCFPQITVCGERRKRCVKIINHHAGYLVIEMRSYCFVVAIICWFYSCGGFIFVVVSDSWWKDL